MAEKRLERSSRLVREGASPQQAIDDDTALLRSAAVAAAKAHMAAADPAIATAPPYWFVSALKP